MQLIKIGNSKGVRIPQLIIKQANLENNELDLRVIDNGIIISPIIKKNRENWGQQIAKSLKEQDCIIDDEWLDANLDSEL